MDQCVSALAWRAQSIRHTHADRESDGHSERYAIPKRDVDAKRHEHPNRYSVCHCNLVHYANRYPDTHAYADTHSNLSADADPNPHQPFSVENPSQRSAAASVHDGLGWEWHSRPV